MGPTSEKFVEILHPFGLSKPGCFDQLVGSVLLDGAQAGAGNVVGVQDCEVLVEQRIDVGNLPAEKGL